MSQQQSVTVMLTTFRRAEVLARTLNAMSQLQFDQCSWQLLVVDNADDVATRLICVGFSDRLPVQHLVCTRPGKSAALNSALPHAKGDLVVFTDDDVLPEPNWLAEMCAGAARWPEHALFAGRVLPDWPSEPSAQVLEIAADLDWGRWTYSVIDLDHPEGPQPTLLPIGNNMAVRRSVFDEGMRFDESIGPRGSNYAMGSETEFNLRLRRMGHAAVYLPGSVVRHQIRPEQLSNEWLIGRAYREGRGEARLSGVCDAYSFLRILKNTIKAICVEGIQRFQSNSDALQLTRIGRSRLQGRLREMIRLKLRS